MPMIDAVLAEFDHESATTRRLLERVPEEKFDWRPHEKSMSLLELTRHIAEMPGWMAAVGGKDELDMAAGGLERSEVGSRDELLAVFDRSVATFREGASALDDEALEKPWRLRTGDEIHFEIPRGAAIRTFIMSHLIHHRGQLSVYLRLLGVALPSIYGPSADEQGFG